MKSDDKKIKFAVEYIKELNGRQAAISAGYSAKTADQAASRLLKSVKVQEKIKELQKIQEETSLVKAEDIIKELANIGFSDVRKIFNQNGGLKEIQELDDNAAACISSVESDELYEGVGQDREQVGETKKVKLWDKIKALELLGKYKRLWNEDSPLKDLLTGVSVIVNKSYGKNG